MPLTPADVHNVAFKKPMLGKRGYDEDDVDTFLDEVERELARLIEENSELRAQVERLRAGAGPGVADTAELAGQMERLRSEKAAAENALRAAQGEIEQLRAQGPAAGGSAADAEAGEQQALRLLMVAQRTADDHVDSARREADKVLGEARAQSEELVRETRAKAESLDREARQRHQEVMGTLETKRAALQKHIEELKAFEREYRTRLKAYLESQLRDLTGRGDGIIDAEVGGGQIEARPVSPGATALTGAFNGARGLAGE
ncbi:cell wall synthesis protein Wag31 [Actinorhabdospora filicis]|uniref:Cell wall synthesis protein Wag31 n=1 Tax=Actinorhabdospora filicis TaxID=1785913 RepID=A0A9W6W6A3_9ACTN|nr:DivIVA domain-containing protein [Actinorhabdospora filicis]GLZ75364.1 cell wall synthesis protein Wag31 [Actinorhabdospora filicis]